MTRQKIIQISPCEPGWYARYKLDEGLVGLSRIVCLALIEEEDNGEFFQSVKGMCRVEWGIDTVDTHSNYDGLEFHPERNDEWFPTKDIEE